MLLADRTLLVEREIAMDITIDQLRTRYESLPTEELLALLAHGELTQKAEFLLMVELRARGYADRDSSLRASAALAEMEEREAPDPSRSDHAGHFAMQAVGLLFIVVAACFSFLARSSGAPQPIAYARRLATGTPRTPA